MKLTEPFLKLPVQFDADRLAGEVRALPQRAWVPHPQGFVGNEAVPLVTPNGEITDAFDGPMAPTEHLLACSYMMEVMRELGAVWGRGRLMALAPDADVPSHVDFNYYWRTHYRVHVPVITNPGVEFTCDGETIHMKAGECWIPDTFRRHAVHNRGSAQRIHLVLDTVGGERFWELIEAAQADASPAPQGAARSSELAFEQVSAPAIMPPYELQYHLASLTERLLPHPRERILIKRLDQFVMAWSAAWARFGPNDDGVPAYLDLIHRVRRDVAAICGNEVSLDNGKTFVLFLDKFVLVNAVARQVIERTAANSSPPAKQAAAR